MQTNAIEKIKEVFAELESSTVLEQLRAEKARKTLAEREAAAARIKAAEAELEKSLPVLQAISRQPFLDRCALRKVWSRTLMAQAVSS